MAGRPSGRVFRQVDRLFQSGAVGTLPDAQLLDRFASGRGEAAEAAFEELVIRHAPMVLRVCLGVLHDAHDAEDAFQAVFLVLASRAGSIRRAGSIASWLFGVARRVALRARRGAARRRSIDRRVAERTPESYLPPEDDPDREILDEELAGLPERLRAPVVLCYLQGMSYEGAAIQLGLSEMTVRGRLARARERLRRRLTRRGLTAPAGLLVVGVAVPARAAVPPSLIHSTVQIALGFTAGHAAAVLARGVQNSMLLNRIKVATALLGLGLGGGYWAWHALAAADDAKAQAPGPKAATVRIVRPTVREIVRVVEQPSYIEAYERTPIFPKITAYIDKWNVDIGDKVKKGDRLATLFAPEVEADYELKRATVELVRERVAVAKEAVVAADADLKEVEARLKALLDPKNRAKASEAERAGFGATIEKAESERRARQSALAKARFDLRLARAELKVAERDEKRMAAMVGYLTLSAPFDGIVTARNANTFDLVQNAKGAAPIYVVDRTDVVRVFIEIPEQDAGYVHVGSKVSVLARGYRDEPIAAAVTRTSWALDAKSRTLRVEIDLPNPGGRILPGMYAYAKLFSERGVRALPTAAVVSGGDQSYCWIDRDGRAVRTPIETGVGDGRWIEVIRRRLPPDGASPAGDGPWSPIDGSERVILGDLSALRDGAPVEVVPESRGPE